MPQPVLFLDRDGTLIFEPQDNYQVDRLDKLSYLPGVFTQLARLRAHTDFRWVMITNQDGLGTASFPEADFWPAHEKMLEALRGEGIVFDEVIIDRTFKHEGKPTRKPGTALLTHYLGGDYDLARSYVIGDRPSDIQLARNLGAKGILLGRSADALDDEWDLAALRRDTLVCEAPTWREVVDYLLGQRARRATVHRRTHETDVRVSVDLDGRGRAAHNTGIGFFDHMLDQLARHSRCDMTIAVQGDLHIDPHHTIEDTALALGQALREALGDKRGIERYGACHLPMDEASSQVAIDFSGRPWLVWQADIPGERVGEFPVEMAAHFFKSLSDAAACNLHVHTRGSNAHHMIEATFKAVARAIRQAVGRIPGDDSLPSTKGVL
ncbi:MAG: bifunctional histidinol-phosphatase/imidazoleglycerol-phosphate dehydratase HisB [Bacteroidia bacterium]